MTTPERSLQYCPYQYRRQNGCGHGNKVLSASDIDADELKTIMVSDVSVCHVLIGYSTNQGIPRKHVHRKCSGGSGANEISSAWTVSQYVESLLVANALRSTIPAFFSVPAFAPDLAKIMNKYRRYDPPPDTERMAA